MEELKEGWKRVKLGEVAQILNGYAFKTNDFKEVGIPVIKIKNITPPKVKLEDIQFVSEKLYKEKIKYEVVYNDILISMTGSHISQPNSVVGRVARVKEKNKKMLLNQRVGKIYPKNIECNQSFLYYYLSQEFIKFELASSAGGSASQANINPSQIKELDFLLPPLETQKKIASILLTLDDKIEINNEMNKTLEEMAQTLFKRWFIDFDFPNENGEPYKSSGGKMVDSELGEIPEGWEVTTLGTKKEFGELVMGLSPKSESYNELQEGLPLLNGAADFAKDRLAPKKYTTSPTRIAKKGDYVFCIRATIGLLTVTDKDYVIGRGVATIKDTKIEYKEYLYMILSNSFERLKQNATGSVIQGLSKPDINNMKMLFPNYATMVKFNKYINKVFGYIEKNRKEIQLLTVMRDTLLPKLMNGEVEV